MALRELECSILQQDRSLAVRPRVKRAPGVNLPAFVTSFIGRERELAETTALLRTPGLRLLTLTGAGGSGKTRLALALATSVVDDYRDGVWFTGLSDLADSHQIADTICQGLDLKQPATLAAEQRLAAFLADRELLLILDNVEQLLPVTDQVTSLFAAGAAVKVLATSREPLGLAGEQQYEVPVLEPDDAVELFTTRARATAPKLEIDQNAAATICERLDRLPLALELAAARSKVLPPEQLLQRLDAALPLLTSGPRDAPRRQRTLRAAIDWSYRLLDEAEQRLFARLAVFTGGCTLAATESVCDADVQTLAALVDRSLLRVVHGRYKMLDTLREYALERLEERGERDWMRRALADWLLALLASATPPRHNPDVSCLIPERENFRAVLEWATQTGDTQTIATLVSTRAHTIWIPQLTEAKHLVDVVLSADTDLAPTLRADTLAAASWVARRTGATESAIELNEQALALYRALDDPDGECTELLMRGILQAERGDLVTARDAFDRVVRVGRERSVTSVMPTALSNLAHLAIEEGDLDTAVALCEESIAFAQHFGLPVTALGISLGYLNLAHVANLQARHADAIAFAHTALGAILARADLFGAAAAAFELAWPLAEIREGERAARLLGAALGYFEYAGATRTGEDEVCEHAARDAIREQLGERRLEKLLEAARKIPLEQALRDELEATDAPTWDRPPP